MILCDTDIMIDVSRGFPGTNSNALQRLLGLIAGMPVIWPDLAACDRAVELMTSFHLSHGLQKYDALVAVTALSSGRALHTFNRKHFGFIPDLQLVEPYVRQ